MTSHTNLFLTNRSQAVRLSRDVAFPANVHEVVIFKDGNRRIIAPADKSWDDFFAAPGIELAPRDQQEAQTREAF